MSNTSKDCSLTSSVSIRQLIHKGAVFVVNHSGGKDSQAMTIRLQRIVPSGQLVLIHSHLPEVEWEGTEDFIRKTHPTIPLYVCQSTKTFLQMVEHRQMWPSPANRQCTSDLKRGPLQVLIRRIAKERNAPLIVNCQGMRGEESAKRKKLTPFRINEGMSKAGRTVYDWLPMHQKSTNQVFDIIHKAGQLAFWTYYKGMSRKSCCFCIMASDRDLSIAAKLRPELYKRICATERRIGHTLTMPKKAERPMFLDERIALHDSQTSLFL